MMHATLEICSGLLADRKITLAPGQTLRIGRTEWADVAIADDQLLSSVHFAIRFEGGDCEVEDLESRNGLMLNGTRVRRARVANGDCLVAGNTTFRVRLEGVGVARPTPAMAPISRAGSQSRRSTRYDTPHVSDARRPYRQALRSEIPAEWHAAMWAAVWAREPWLLEFCRSVAVRPVIEDLEILRLFAVLAVPTDLPLIRSLAARVDLGPTRYEVLATFGHPELVPILIRAFGEGSRDAVAAVRAFTRMTGIDLLAEVPRNGLDRQGGSEQVDEDPDESSGPPRVPDYERALSAWRDELSHLHGAERICRGQDVSQSTGLEGLAALDLQARWHAAARAHFHGRWTVTPMQLLAYPRTCMPVEYA